MKVIFAGTPEFSAVALQVLLDEGFDVPLVLTQPDRPAGRGLKLQLSPVKQLAQKYALPVLQPHSLRLDGNYQDDARAAQARIAAANADFMVVAAYGLILPQWTLDAPQRGCLNIHASLLPRWRGAAPIHRAIEAGDFETGVTIMQMDSGLDTGAILLKKVLPIAQSDTTQTLQEKLADLGAALMTKTLRDYTSLVPAPQPSEGVSYAAKIMKSESAIDWTQSAAAIERKIRAFNPAPACTAVLNGEVIKVWQAQLAPRDDALAMQAGDGVVLYLSELQRAGGRRMSAAEYLRGLMDRTNRA